MSEKKYPIGGYAPGNYQCHCGTCGGGFIGDKRACQCEPCALNDRAKFDALLPNQQDELVKKNAQIAGEMFEQIRAGKSQYPGSSYQPLFDYLNKHYGLSLLQSEMDELISLVNNHHGRGPVWVKASVSTPDHDGQVHLKVDGQNRAGNFYEAANGRINLYVSGPEPYILFEDKFGGVEWLCDGEAELIEALVPCAEDDPDCIGAYTSYDGRSLCHVKEIKVKK